ncbi:MAG: hypothetical protein BWY69_00829 [Planctomycetes bacterium ADurb.Bin401]|nr:MAG: hypothetical protein BWY69_00829 [Planctomycetes bacterium ADurb.Bin401]
MKRQYINSLLVSILFIICGFVPAICCAVDECESNECSCSETESSKTPNILDYNNSRTSISKKFIANDILELFAENIDPDFICYYYINNDSPSFYNPLKTIILLA